MKEINIKKINDKYLPKIKELLNLYDVEVIHDRADTILCEILKEIGLVEIVEVFDKLEKWYA